MKLTFLPLLALILTAFPQTSKGTAQAPDRIIYEGAELPLFANPLESYFSGSHKRPDVFEGELSSTANWRGYIATWEVKDGRLFLVKIEKEYPKKGQKDSFSTEWREIPAGKVFPGRKGPIVADWFTGILRVPRGEELQYVHMGYESVYEKDLLIHINHGTVEKTEEVDNRPRPRKKRNVFAK